MNDDRMHRARARLTAAWLLLAAVAGALPVHAQPLPRPSPSATAPGHDAASIYDDDEAQVAEARKRYLEGVAAGRKKDWPRAYAAFSDAWKLKKHPQIALNLGRAELETARYREAIGHFRYCIEHSDSGNPDGQADIGMSQDWLAEARKKAAQLVVTVDLAGARVFVDDELIGRSPLSEPVPVNPGRHVVQARLGDTRADQGVVAESGATLPVDLMFPKTMHLALSPPSSDRSSDFGTVLGSGRSIALLAGLGGTVTGLVVGIAAGVAAMEKQEDQWNCTAKREPAGSECWTASDHDRQVLAWTSFGGFAGAGLFALGTGVLYSFGPKDRPAPAKAGAALTWTPIAAPTGGGLVVTGHF